MKEREDCELFYLSYIAQVGHKTEEAVIASHPRYQELRTSALPFQFLVLMLIQGRNLSRIWSDGGLRRAASRQPEQPHHKCVAPWQGRKNSLDITSHSLKRTTHIQLTDKGFSDPRTLDATNDYQSPALDATSNPSTETS